MLTLTCHGVFDPEPIVRLIKAKWLAVSHWHPIPVFRLWAVVPAVFVVCHVCLLCRIAVFN